MVHFYIIIIYVVNNSLIKYFYKFTLFEIIYFLIFIFLPGAYIFLKNQLIANFIFLCKLNLINIEQKKLREQCSHSRLISPVFLHMLGEYGKLLCKLPFLVQIREKISPRIGSEYGHFPHSGQIWCFISFPWCSIIKTFSFKHKQQIPVLFVGWHLLEI